MSVCENLSGCPFVAFCNKTDKSSSVNGFINMYCKGSRMDTCIRLRLCHQFDRTIVPKNMMPNGLPLPGTGKDDWSDQAINFRRLLK